MFHRLTLVTAPTVDALTLAEAKAHLRVDHDDEDGLIGDLIADAAAMIDGPDGIGFAMQPQTWRLDLDAFPARIRLALRPAVSVTSITYLDADEAEQTLPADHYRVSIVGGLATITEGTGHFWPSTADVPGAVSVTFVAGEGVPAPLKVAMLLILGDLYKNREATADKAVMEHPAVASRVDRYRLGVVAA